MKSLWKVKGFEKQTSWKVMRFLEKMSKQSVESLGDADVQIVLYIPLSLFHSGWLKLNSSIRQSE